MKRLSAVFMFLLLTVSTAFALSDAEYNKMKKNSKEFARADKNLTQVWNRLRKQLPAKDFEKLKKSQRSWIKSGRDENAKEYINEGYSRVEAYTIATKDRVIELQDMAREIKNTKTTKSNPKPQPNPKPKPEPEFEEEPEENYDDDDNKGEIEEDRFNNLEPGDVSGNYTKTNGGKQGGFMTVLITDKDSNEASVTISFKNPEITWSASGWISVNNELELFDKDYPDCQANLTFSNNQVKIETSDSENWDTVLGTGIKLDGTYKK
ncbi:MAG: DUF1311 domain-containing protein [Synergistaceae bacterium]|nr:DUF1311 domain-containing protein [Synergistaceae bacterium]